MLLMVGLGLGVLAFGYLCLPLWVDLSITATQVLKGSDATTNNGIAGATITAGQPLYLNASSSLALCDADGDATTSVCVGIALHGASAGQPIHYQTGGSITLGAAAAMTVGETYLTSDTAGGIRPVADVDAGDYVSILGVASSASVLKMCSGGIFNSAAVHA